MSDAHVNLDDHDHDDDGLEQQVAATLAAHARHLAVDPRPFEPVHPSLDLGGGDPAGPPRSWSSPALLSLSSPGRRRVLRAAAAVVAVAAVVTGVVVGRGGEDGRDVRDEDVWLGSVPGGVPGDALVPTWEGPDGWELSGLNWGVVAPEASAGTVQLLGEPSDDEGLLDEALLVEIGVGAGGTDAPERTTVRGQPGLVRPDSQNPGVTVLRWDEVPGVHLRASYRGLSTPEAVAILDALTVRPGGVQAGFDLPAEGPPRGLALLGEARVPDLQARPTVVTTMFGRATERAGGTGDRLRYRVVVETVAPTGEPTPEYIARWFTTGRGDDDLVQWWSPPSEAGRASLIYPGGVLRTLGPDGRVAAVTINAEAVADDDLGSPEDVARDITDSLAPAVSELWASLVDQWMGRELRASVPTPAGTVELRGRAPEPVLCLRNGDALTCAPAVRPDQNDMPEGDDDDQWTATVPGDDGDRLLAVSDRGPILMEVLDADATDEDGQVFVFPDAEEGEADGFWAAVLPRAIGPGTGPSFIPPVVTDDIPPDEVYAEPLTDVALQAEACLKMLGNDPMSGGPYRARPDEEARIRSQGGGPVAMYQACRELESGSWYP